MLWIYNIGIVLYGFLLYIISPFHTKASLFIKGRKNIWKQLQEKIGPNDRPIWFHFASLGEFEQGRPVLEEIKTRQPSQKIIITFFSPSGYEIRKNYALADVFYLPLDTASNARKFIALTNPKQAVFTKYEFWHHYFHCLGKNKIPLYLISGIFRPNQVFFKWYGAFYRRMLNNITHFFVQNKESVALLKSIGINRVSLSGDTRFDRVYQNAQHPKKLAAIAAFCGTSNVLIAGSTWQADEKLLVALAAKFTDWKLIIAPHEIGEVHLNEIEKLFPNAARFSDYTEQSSTSHAPQVLIINNIGMLSSLYQYGKVAYIGGGFGAGIHNTLEAAAFGLPVIFGPKYAKFQEAKDLITLGAAKSIQDEAGLIEAFIDFKQNNEAALAARQYVAVQKGATAMIIKKIAP